MIHRRIRAALLTPLPFLDDGRGFSRQASGQRLYPRQQAAGAGISTGGSVGRSAGAGQLSYPAHAARGCAQ